MLASYSRKLPKAYRAVGVESLVAVMALSFALDIGISRAILEDDSLEVFKALTDEKPALTSLGILINYFTFTLRERVILLLIVWLDMLLTYQTI